MNSKNQKPSMYDVSNFTIRDMTECCKVVRTIGKGAKNMEEVANSIVNHLYVNLIDGQSGNKACSLVRFFKTHTFEKLDPELQNFSKNVSGNSTVFPETKCLTLLATVGENPAWNSRKTSKGHRAIPLLSEEMVDQIPMIKNLITQLGLDTGMVVKPDPRFLLDKDAKMYNVFCVPEALGSPCIPAQKEFVVPYGIKSVIGFGGLFPSGDVFAIIMFLKCTITNKVADLFKILAQNVKIAVLPFEDIVFDQPVKVAAYTTEIQNLKDRVVAMEQLLEVYEQSVIEQTMKFLEEVSEHKKVGEILKDREQFLQTLMEAMPVPVFYKDKGGKYIGCNSAFEDFLGMRKEEIIGKTVYEVAPKELADRYHEADAALFQSGGSQVYEAIVKHHKGSVHDVLFHKAVFYDREGTLSGLIGVILDITQRKRTEEILRHRTDFEKTVATISRRFVTLSDFDAAVNASLEDAGRLCMAGRAYLFQFRDNGAIIDNTHEWCDSGVNPEMNNLQNIPVIAFPWSIKNLQEGKIVHVADVSKMPDEAIAERTEFERQSIKSLLLLPIHIEKKLLGFIGFDNVKSAGRWSEDDVTLLNIMSEILGNAIARVESEKLISHMAYHDPLTKLPNRNLLHDRLKVAMAHAIRSEKMVAIIMLDLDGFKMINDSFGHQMGDLLLKAVAERLMQCSRGGDTIARMGGDEFIIVIPDLAQTEDAALFAQKILDALRQPFLIEKHEVHTTASIGITIFPLYANDSESLFKQADVALYLSKAKGKNTYQIYKPGVT
ncbi:MAG: diguanylate cyclase [Candidatus Kuenenia sp.]|nr:diguanylate cyclase [Candidatus Kuenenia sp.]